MRKKISLITISLISFLAASQALAAEINFSVTERENVARLNGVISYAIPLSESINAVDVSSFGVIGQEAEFTVLSRYNDIPAGSNPIRTVLVTMQDNISASGTNNYVLTTTAGSGSVSGNNLATDNAGYIEVNTGTSSFKISKASGNLFDFVSVGGTTLINSPSNSGMVVNVGGVEYTSRQIAPESVTIYHNGPMYAQVVVSGELRDANNNQLKAPTSSLDGVVPDSPVRYSFYYTFFKNKNFVKVEQTLKNNGKGWSRYATESIHNLYVNSWRTDLEYTQAASNKVAEFSGYSDPFSSETYTLSQNENNHHGFNVNSYDWSWDLKKGEVSQLTGTQYESYAGIKDLSGGITLASKWFWQNYPAEYSVTNNILRYSFLPGREAGFSGFDPGAEYSMPDLTDRYLDNSEQYRILGGMWKTYQTVYYFHTSGSGYDEAAAEIRSPLIIQCDADYVAQTKFFNFQVPPNLTINHTFAQGEVLQDSIDRWFEFGASQYDPAYDYAFGKSFQTFRQQRNVPIWKWTKISDSSSYYTYPSWYGWLRFGSSPRALNFGFNNQHYDFAWNAWQGWARFGTWTSYETFEELVEHHVDILSLHDQDAVSGDEYLLHGAQRYEEDSLADNYHERTLNINDPHMGAAHQWTRGPYVQYLLTGSPRYKEVLDSYASHVNRAKMIGSATIETRDLTRLIGMAINHYETFGDTSSLDDAWDMWERLRDGGTDIGNDKFTLDVRIDTDSLWFGYSAMNAVYLVRLWHAFDEAGMTARRDDLGEKLLKMSVWFRDMAMAALPNTPGTYLDANTYYKYTASNSLELNPSANGDLSLDLPYSWSSLWNSNYSMDWCDILAWAYLKTKDESWRTMARTIFKDRYMYNSAASDQIENPLSPYWQPLGFPASYGSGSWKTGIGSVEPSYYLAVESGLYDIETEDAVAPSSPIGLSVW